jgi:hypothetical protein
MYFDIQIFILFPVTGVQFFRHKRQLVHDKTLVLVKLFTFLMLLKHYIFLSIRLEC